MLIAGKFFVGDVIRFALGTTFVVGASVVLWTRPWPMKVLFLWGVVYATAISVGASWWPWYLPPLVLTYAAGIGVTAQAVYSSALLKNPTMTRAATAVVLLSITGALATQLRAKAKDGAAGYSIMLSQRVKIGSWLAACSPVTTSVFTEPVGMIGFVSGRRMVDYPGLVSPAVTDSLRVLGHRIHGKPSDPEVLSGILRALSPDVLVLRQDEYEGGRAALANYKVIRVFGSGSGANRFPDMQPMFVLGRSETERLSNLAACVSAAE